MEQRNLNDYVLRSGEKGAERLKLLAHVMWPTTKRLLHRAGLVAGMRCLDAGCGAGAVTLKMARWVGPAGEAVGIDLDERCLGLAREQAIVRKLPAVFRQEGVLDLQEQASYDLVFGRFLLTHLPKPDKGVERLVQATRPGGLVVVEDIEFAGHFSFPACPAFDRYVSLYQQVVRQKGADPDIGPRLLGLLLDAGLDPVLLNVVQPAYYRGPGKQIASVTMEHIRESVVAAGLATDDEVTAIVAQLQEFVANPLSILSLPRIFQVWGRRPG